MATNKSKNAVQLWIAHQDNCTACTAKNYCEDGKLLRKAALDLTFNPQKQPTCAK